MNWINNNRTSFCNIEQFCRKVLKINGVVIFEILIPGNGKLRISACSRNAGKANILNKFSTAVVQKF